jgi:hypothetical protein
MKITFATVLLGAWFVSLPGALVGAIWSCNKHGRKGIFYGLEMMLGSLCLFGFVSGVVGLYETNDYVQSFEFWCSMALGLGGLILIGLGLRAARASAPRKTRPETA